MARRETREQHDVRGECDCADDGEKVAAVQTESRADCQHAQAHDREGRAGDGRDGRRLPAYRCREQGSEYDVETGDEP